MWNFINIFSSLDNFIVFSCVILMLIFFSSPDILAENKKEEGNTYYKQKLYTQALLCYSDAIGKYMLLDHLMTQRAM